MSRSPVQVVVGYDFSASALPALQRAVALANRAPYHVLHVVCAISPHHEVQTLPHRGRADYEYAEHVQAAVAERIAQELRDTKARRVDFCVHARIGEPATEILDLAREVGASLILVGTNGLTGAKHFVLGSVAERVVREAGCTVEVARAKSYPNVPLAKIFEVPPSAHHYVPPHRYSYEQQTAMLRPDEWPLY